MENKPIFKRKFIPIFSVLFFFVFFILNSHLVSATAQFNIIPSVSLTQYQETIVNLNSYCYSDTYPTGCASSSYWIQFINPDNSQTVTLFPSGSLDTSYFFIQLKSNGLIDIQSKAKTVNYLPITVHASDVPLTSQATVTSFNININPLIAPVQIQSVGNLVLNGNQTAVYSVSNLFLNYDTVRVTFDDPVLAQSVQIGISQGGQCSTGAITVCVNATSEGNAYLTVSGLNTGYSGLMTVTASNQWGHTSLSFQVTVIPVQLVAPQNPPSRNPFSIAPIQLQYYDSQIISIDQLWSNYTFVNATFYNPDTASNSTIAFGTIGSITYTNSYLETSQFIIDLESFNSPHANLRVISKNISTNFTIYMTACNPAGCDSTDNAEPVYIAGVLPTANPVSLGQILMGFNQVKNYDMNLLFSNYNKLKITYTDPINSRKTIISQSGITLSSSMYDFGTPAFIGGDFNTVFHYVVTAHLNSGNLSFNGGQQNLTGAGYYQNLIINSNAGQDFNITATGSATINSISLFIDQLNVTLENQYNKFPSTINSYNVSGTLNVLVVNSTGNFTVTKNIAVPFFFPKLYEHGILSITSGTTEESLTLYPTACNPAGCVSGTFLNNIVGNFSIPLIITSNPYPELSQVQSPFIQNLLTFFLNLFPDNVSLIQGILISLLTMLFADVIFFILFAIITKGESDSYIVPVAISFFADAGLFIFFIFKGYIPTAVWITLCAIGIIGGLIALFRGKK